MAKILITGTSGSHDPTQASMPFITARGAWETGHEPIIFLANEATYLLKDVIAKDVKGVGWPTISELLQEVVAHQVPIYV